ncbi:MAG: hypothetical protein PSW75_11235 [bacterium]|nr:hypothetical protein [bacterium]MDI1337670.1 hypothetical protein [Lacunisphaera sp.]
MKDNRFIDLVNLYIDRQITAAETAELEAEIQSNPRRRAIYQQYCQMHRATTLVYESFRANAPETQTAGGEGTIAHFERERRTPWSYYAAGLAAAAGVALVFVQLNARKAADANLLAKSDSLPAVQVAAAQPHAVVGAPAVEPMAGLVSLRNSAATEQDYAVMLTAMRQEEQRAFASGQRSSLFDDDVFGSPQVMPVGNPRVFRSKQSPAQQAEFTAFQFQR